MKRLSIIIFFSLTFLNTFGQVKKKDLLGTWRTNNNENVYYQNDTVKFFMDINHSFGSETCNLIMWNVEKRNFKLINSFICSEPGKLSYSSEKESMKLLKSDYGRLIYLERAGNLFDKFRIIDYVESRVDRYPYDIKELVLMRFDNLEEEKLYKYVDSLIYKVLKYDSTKLDSSIHKVMVTSGNPDIKLRIRDGYNPNPLPLIILNGHPLEDREILKAFLLVETYKISCLKNEDTPYIYGYRAHNGVIILQVSEKKFKKVWKNYSR